MKIDLMTRNRVLSLDDVCAVAFGEIYRKYNFHLTRTASALGIGRDKARRLRRRWYEIKGGTNGTGREISETRAGEPGRAL